MKEEPTVPECASSRVLYRDFSPQQHTDPARGVSEWLSWSWLKTRTLTPRVTPYRLVFCACCNLPWAGPTTTKPGAAFATIETEVQAASSNHKRQNTHIKMCTEGIHKWQNVHRLKILMSYVIAIRLKQFSLVKPMQNLNFIVFVKACFSRFPAKAWAQNTLNMVLLALFLSHTPFYFFLWL